jgi:hypothetical protein
VRPFKGIIYDDISEFESHMPSHAVGLSQVRSPAIVMHRAIVLKRSESRQTIGFDLLYAIVIVRLVRRDLVLINVTTHPTAEWIARQITEAFPWNEAPRYLIRE